jgi:tRNA pseudouridine38-40 synthase
MPQRFKLTIAYDGSAYRGWQVQPDGSTVQGVIEQALQVITQDKVRLFASGRTDAGVHALGQVAHFDCPKRLDARTLQNGLNSLLPPDVVIMACDMATDIFHARYDAKLKHYRYRILNRRLPMAIGRQYVWHVPSRLDLKSMAAAANHLMGRHDFGAFESTGSPRAHAIRRVTRAEFLTQADGIVHFEIEAEGFLKQMVRNIVGTLVQVGLGRMRAGDIPRILATRDRRQAGPTAPASGLFLVRVFY